METFKTLKKSLKEKFINLIEKNFTPVRTQSRES
jgi:hypothetical protein